jgi:hypothetical protein
MPYSTTTHKEARYINHLGPNPTQDNFSGLYDLILWHWFPVGSGFRVRYHDLAFIVHRGDIPDRNPLLVVKFNEPSCWTAAGRQTVLDELIVQMKGGFNCSQYDTIYGLAGIGQKWMVCKMKLGDDQPTTVLDWQDDIASNASYASFETIVGLLSKMVSE